MCNNYKYVVLATFLVFYSAGDHLSLHCTDCETGYMHQPPGIMLICTAAMVLGEWPASKSGQVGGVFFRHPAETSARYPAVVIRVAGCDVDVCKKLKTLGVSLDSALSFEDHINGIIHSCNYHIRALRHIRRDLTREVANMVACSIVGTRIDYCN